MGFRSDVRNNLREIRAGYYLNENDPLYWRKLLNFKPEDKEAIYHVAGEIEQNANNHLNAYNNSQEEGHLKLYDRYLLQSKNMYKKSLGLGYIPAKSELLRLEQKPVQDKPSKKSWSNSWIYFLIILLSLLITLYFVYPIKYKVESSIHTIQNSFAFIIPYHVNKERPISIPNLNFNQSNLDTKDISEEALANSLLTTLKGRYQLNSREPILIRALNPEKKEVGLAIWNGGDNPIEIYVYPNLVSSSVARSQSQEEATIVIRSTLYQYLKDTRSFPPNLNVLIQAFPSNYLTDLPKEAYSNKNSVAPNFDSSGGWVYNPPSIDIPSSEPKLKELVQNALKPNFPAPPNKPFEPLTIYIAKDSNTLYLLSGDKIIREYPVALGKNNLTPEGSFLVNRKIVMPDKAIPLNKNAYGSRAMELSNKDYAIHGTNDPNTIGENVSLGCIRLRNPDVEELYSMTPLNTSVTISRERLNNNQPNSGINLLDQSNPYNQNPSPQEENPVKDYHWNT